jgi:hypothetical protein
MGDSFFERYFAFLIQPHEIMMYFYVLHQISIRPGRRDGDVSSRSEKIQPCAFEKIGELGLQDEILCLNSRRKGHPGVNISDVCLNVRVTTLSRNRHAVIAIIYEVGISNLKELDRRQTRALIGEKLDSSPSLLVAVASRQKIASKVLISPNASDDGVQRYILQYAPISPHSPYLLTHLLKRKKIRRLSSQRGDDLLQVGAVACPQKILLS